MQMDNLCLGLHIFDEPARFQFAAGPAKFTGGPDHPLKTPAINESGWQVTLRYAGRWSTVSFLGPNSSRIVVGLFNSKLAPSLLRPILQWCFRLFAAIHGTGKQMNYKN